MKKFPVIVALDGMEKDRAIELANKLSGKVWGFKIHSLADKYGSPEIIQILKPFGNVFVDMKLHDIPNTVKERTAALIANGADLVTVHASGGEAMMRAAIEAGGEKVAAVTVLTSSEAATQDVVTFAEKAHGTGITNIVCSPQEAAAMRAALPNITIITPGIRAASGTVHDQKRISTPQEALTAGADYLVIGRAITQATDPVLALEELMQK